MDRDVNRLAAAISIAMIGVIFIITCVSVKPYNTVEQEDVLYVGSTRITVFNHPVLQPTTSEYGGTGPMRAGLGEALRVSPYDYGNSTSGWSCYGAGEQGRYVCTIRWATGYSVYVAGIDLFDGSAPGKTGSFTFIDATGPTDGRVNPLHMGDNIRLDGPIYTVTG
jgi:hypothetical protein